MSTARSFRYIANSNARLLVLGSMPGAASLVAQRYYAHPRNQFWPLMMALCDVAIELDYDARIARLKQRQIALWDVLAECRRNGSLDANIVADSLRCNDFARFFREHRQIELIAFNGQTAHTIYRRDVWPTLAAEWQALPLCVLPSSSPANAAKNFDAKLVEWRQLLSAFSSS